MRLLFLSTHGEPCGIATYTEALESALSAQGCEVNVLSPHRIDDGRDEARGTSRLWSRDGATMAEAAHTVALLRKLRPDVVHIQHNLGLYSARFLAAVHAGCRRYRIALTTTLHGRAGGSAIRRARLRRHLLALGISSVVVHNEAHRRELPLPRRTTVIPHGVFPPEPADLTEAKRALGIDPADPVLAHFGFLHPHKGVREVLEVVSRLQSKGRRLHYLICGGAADDGISRDYLAQLREGASHAEMSEHIRVDGRFLDDEELMARLRAADWIVLNYRAGGDQGTSGAARHALRAGRPLAISTAPIFDDMRSAAHTLKGPLDNAVAELLDDAGLAGRTLQRARRYCERHGWDVIATRHLTHYGRIKR